VRLLAALPLPALVAPLYGAFDLTEATTESREAYAEGWVLSEKFVGLFERHLSHGRSPEATAALRALPFASPLRAPRALLARMPRTLLVAAEHDMLRDDSANMLAALRAGGARAELLVAPGQVHGFAQFPRELAAGRRFMEAEVYPRMREALLAEGGGGGAEGAGAGAEGAGAGAQPAQPAQAAQAEEVSTVI
jgi:acetyl esterase/lipase